MPLEGDVNLGADGSVGEGHNFSNPMYEAMGGAGGASSAAAGGAVDTKQQQPSTKGLYEVPLDSPPEKVSPLQHTPSSSVEPLGALTGTQAPVGASKPPPPSTTSTTSKLAILSPSAILHKSGGGGGGGGGGPSLLNLRPKELSPSSRDTGKDTQSLVTEDDNSEC